MYRQYLIDTIIKDPIDKSRFLTYNNNTVTNHMEMVMLIHKQCEECGDWFWAKMSKVRFCNKDHYRNCPICGKPVKMSRENLQKNYTPVCSYKCRALKTRETSIERYGCPAPGNNPKAREKASETMINKLGVPFAMQSQDVRNKSKQTMIDKYGVDNIAKNPEYLAKRVATARERYGGILPFNSKESYDKMHETMRKRYGESYYVNTKEFAEAGKHNRISKINVAFGDLLKHHTIEFEYEKTIGHKYFDIYIPESNTLVEINPAYTHSAVPNHMNDKGEFKYYSIDKCKLARESGYRSVIIYDNDDWEKLIGILSKPILSVYARDCTLYKLNEDVGKKFIDEYDVSGNCRGQTMFLGLVYHGQIIQVMSFGRSRFNSNYYVELMRFCTRPRYRVIGGLSKLYQFARTYFDLHSIICYNDLSKFDGASLTKIGLKLLKINPPRLVWRKGKKAITNYAEYRYYHKSKEEMLQDGWIPQWDCGQSVYTDGEPISR